MENKNIIQYTLMLAIVMIGVLGVISFFRISGNLKESKKIIESVLLEVKESKDIIKKQATTINELQKLNQELSLKVKQLDSVNYLIKKSLEINFFNTNRTMSEIKKTVDNIKPPPIIH
ncbi:MAG: hypothetical protein WCR72_16745 [Bacteroidota bacterium]